MKLFTLAPVFAHGAAVAMASVLTSHGDAARTTLGTDASHTEDQMEKCIQVAGTFIKEPVLRGEAVEAAANYCSSAAHVKDPGNLCPHFKEAVELALEHDQSAEKYDATAFCTSTEEYVGNLQGAARVPNTGSGPLLNFKVSPACESTVASAFAPEKALDSASVPDFWYAVCNNQNCAHFLPSRTKWCNVQKPPTHSWMICNGVRKFAHDEAEVHEGSKMTPKQICALYAEYVKEMGIDEDAYKKVMHHKTAEK